MASPHGNDRGARWVDGDPTTGDIARATTDEGSAKAEIQHTRNYVWNTNTLVWDRMTAASAGSAVSVADGADVAQGTTTDASTANTVIGILKAIKANTGGGGGAVNITGINGVAPDVNSGVKSAGTLRVILATDQPALTNKLLVTPDLPAGASTAAKQPALGVAGTASVDVITVQGIASMTKLLVTPDANSAINNAQVAGTAVDVNSGLKSAGTQRIVIATDQPQLTNALKVDGSAVTQPVSGTVTANIGTTNGLALDATLTGGTAKVGLAPQTAGGLSIFHLVSAATTNATNVKAGAGQLFGYYIYNSNAAARKVAFHNTAGSPTAGASVAFAIVIPPGSAANVEFSNGIAFATGIAITTVTGLTDADATAVAASDLIINLFFK